MLLFSYWLSSYTVGRGRRGRYSILSCVCVCACLCVCVRLLFTHSTVSAVKIPLYTRFCVVNQNVLGESARNTYSGALGAARKWPTFPATVGVLVAVVVDERKS